MILIMRDTNVFTEKKTRAATGHQVHLMLIFGLQVSSKKRKEKRAMLGLSRWNVVRFYLPPVVPIPKADLNVS